MRWCEHEKTFTGIFLLVHFCYETTSVCIELISVCVESTLDVYQNRLPFVSKRLCVKASTNLSNLPQTALHIWCDAFWDQYNTWKNITYQSNWSFNIFNILPGVGAFEQLFGPVRGEYEQKFSKNSNAWGLPGGDVEALIWLVHYSFIYEEASDKRG